MKGNHITISAVIPVCNEAERIGNVIKEAREFVDEIIVVDDSSTDGSKQVAEKSGATVIMNEHKKGYIGAIKTGFEKAKSKLVVTLDADGEHNPEDIPLLVAPIHDGKADLVLGKREKIPKKSEDFINWLTGLRVKIGDSCTGFRAIKKDLASKLELKGKCSCGTFVLEANHYGARITEVPIKTIPIDKPKRIAWYHIGQTFYVLSWLLKRSIS